jgi:hypothetical protein
MSAPSAIIRSPSAIARAASKRIPPSANESGVTLMMPMTSVRAPSWSGARPGSGTE